MSSRTDSVVISNDAVLGVAPFFHAHGLGNAMLASVASGAELILVESFNRKIVLDLIRRKSVTFFPGVPLMFSALAATAKTPESQGSSLTTCFSAGSPLQPDVSDQFRSKFGVPVRQLYGCSEAGSVTINLDDGADFKSDSVGKPIGWGEVKIVDESGTAVNAGTQGDIAISIRDFWL